MTRATIIDPRKIGTQLRINEETETTTQTCCFGAKGGVGGGGL